MAVKPPAVEVLESKILEDLADKDTAVDRLDVSKIEKLKQYHEDVRKAKQDIAKDLNEAALSQLRATRMTINTHIANVERSTDARKEDLLKALRDLQAELAPRTIVEGLVQAKDTAGQFVGDHPELIRTGLIGGAIGLVGAWFMGARDISSLAMSAVTSAAAATAINVGTIFAWPWLKEKGEQLQKWLEERKKAAEEKTKKELEENEKALTEQGPITDAVIAKLRAAITAKAGIDAQVPLTNAQIDKELGMIKKLPAARQTELKGRKEKLEAEKTALAKEVTELKKKMKEVKDTEKAKDEEKVATTLLEALKKVKENKELMADPSTTITVGTIAIVIGNNKFEVNGKPVKFEVLRQLVPFSEFGLVDRNRELKFVSIKRVGNNLETQYKHPIKKDTLIDATLTPAQLSPALSNLASAAKKHEFIHALADGTKYTLRLSVS